MVKRFIILSVVLFNMCFFLFGQTDQSDFEIENGVLIKYKGTDKYVKIPENLGIIEIDRRAFDPYNNGATPGLREIIIPEGVVRIQAEAFLNCTSIRDITIPKSVLSIGVPCFPNCFNLGAIYVNEENEIYGSFDGVLYNKAGTNLIRYPPAKRGNVVFKNGVETIARNAFAFCKGLTVVNIPDGVRSIESGAFNNSSVIRITIPESVTSIDGNTFHHCTDLISIFVDEKNDKYKSIDGVLFYKNMIAIISYPVANPRTFYIIPSEVTIIGDFAFNDAKQLRNIIIPNGVVHIGNYAFYGCSNLINIIIPDSVNSIGEYAFWRCTSLTSINIPESVNSFDANVFAECNPIKINLSRKTNITNIERYTNAINNIILTYKD